VPVRKLRVGVDREGEATAVNMFGPPCSDLRQQVGGCQTAWNSARLHRGFAKSKRRWMAAKERKERKRGGKKCPACEKLPALRAVPSSLPEEGKWLKNLFFCVLCVLLWPSSLPDFSPPSCSQQWGEAPAEPLPPGGVVPCSRLSRSFALLTGHCVAVATRRICRNTPLAAVSNSLSHCIRRKPKNCFFRAS